MFQFIQSIAAVGTASVSVSSVASTTSQGSDVIVTLAGVPDNRRVTASLTGVNGSVSLGFLVGDINNSRTVNSSDVSGVKARSGQATNSSDFKFDLNASAGRQLVGYFGCEGAVGIGVAVSCRCEFQIPSSLPAIQAF